MFKNIIAIISCSVFIISTGCNNPKVIEAESTGNGSVVESIMGDDHNHQTSQSNSSAGESHNVVVTEVLQAQKYTYLKVNEKNEDFWIAIPKADIQVGEKFYYEGGLLKRNFKSLEFDKVFETLYLVSRFQRMESKTADNELDEAFAQMSADHEATSETVIQPMEPKEGVVSLSTLLASPKEFEGKVIQVQGQVVKLNNQIMGRNWIHIQDGKSTNGNQNDLTITTMEQVLMGAKVIFEGKISLDQDFGAGYRYDIIMEGASLK
jgi:hypothetical protein